MKTGLILFAIGTLLVGCAKKKEYKEVYKENTFSKTLLSSDPNDPYVYIPSVENTPMNVTASRPYWLGEQKLVIFKFRENALEVLEVPSDKRFAQNENNFSPVFTLDIAHKDYRCEKNEYNECSNKEEEVKDAKWESKRFFQADFAKLTVLETNTLPEQLKNLFNNCFTDKGSIVKDLQVDEDSLNITVQRTMTADVKCANLESFDDLRNLTYKVNYHYSFVKLSKIASQNYEPVLYPFEDQTTFGYFTTTQKKLTADNRTTLNSEMTLLNRWNPKNKQIIYNLNEEFYSPGMESIKKATEDAVAAVNSSFTRAGVDLQIKLEDGRNKKIGDLRNNFFVLVKDPQASGVIGYGPSVANPQTGEILKGQVVMYYGTIRKFVQDTYEEVLEEKKQEAARKASDAAAAEARAPEGHTIKDAMTEEMALTQTLNQGMRDQLLGMFRLNLPEKPQTSPTILSQTITPKLSQKLKSEIFSHERVHMKHSLEDKIEDMSRHNMYHESMVNWHGALEAVISEGDLDFENAVPWNELKEEDKEAIINKVMPYVWIPTLVHEIGHNLGLRHNFNGSEDKANYYTKDEGGKLGLSKEVTYSSVMDYSYSSLNQLSIMGKYDIAALAFGYNREIELKDGQIVKMPKSTLEEMKIDKSIEKMRDFRFCTDEHVAVNPGCNRFDEGTNLEEMARHYVKAYKKNYNKKNKRNNRLNFSSVSDAEHYLSVRHTFQELRIFFEVFDRIKGQYSGITEEQWESIEFLKDLKAATRIAADFYLEVLKTPSVHCAVEEIKSGELAGIVALEMISSDALDCFDEENIKIDLKRFKVIAETGKHFNHVRGTKLPSHVRADPSQLDTRGIWMDKLLAMEFLTKREMGMSSFDDFRTSFLDHPEFKGEVLGTFLEIMSDKISADVVMEHRPSGKMEKLTHTFEIGQTHNISKSFSDQLNQHLRIRKSSTDLRELLFPMVKHNLLTADDERSTYGLLQSISVLRVEPTTFVGEEVAAQADLKDEQGRSVSKFVATHDNILAKKMIDGRNLKVKLDKVPRAKLIEVYRARAQGKESGEIPEELKLAHTIEVDDLLAYLQGQLLEDDLLQKLLTIMSR